ncbi:MAG TPA: hypothetical protein VFM18_05930 [Methanosarcina sp.]|nr:hypothetical protein [Methanosarcina sp.]
MSLIVVNPYDSFEQWRVKTNQIASQVATAGVDLTGLMSVETGLQQTDVITAFNEAYRLATALSLAMS